MKVLVLESQPENDSTLTFDATDVCSRLARMYFSEWPSIEDQCKLEKCLFQYEKFLIIIKKTRYSWYSVRRQT